MLNNIRMYNIHIQHIQLNFKIQNMHRNNNIVDFNKI